MRYTRLIIGMVIMVAIFATFAILKLNVEYNIEEGNNVKVEPIKQEKNNNVKEEPIEDFEIPGTHVFDV